MFELNKIAKYLSLISYIGFIIASISGFVEINNNYNTCILMNSIVVLSNITVLLYFELIDRVEQGIDQPNYLRSFVQINFSLLIMSVSSVGIGFGLYGMVIGLINLFIGFFCVEELGTSNSNNNSN